jgi:glucose-6-phosphate-specific signal transduction histidine kinase
MTQATGPVFNDFSSLKLNMEYKWCQLLYALKRKTQEEENVVMHMYQETLNNAVKYEAASRYIY